MKDDAEDEDLEDQANRFQRELGESLQAKYREELVSIVESECIDAAESLLQDLHSELEIEGIGTVRRIESSILGLLQPNDLSESSASVYVDGKTKGYGPKFSDFALPGLALLAYCPLGAIALGTLSVVRMFKDKVCLFIFAPGTCKLISAEIENQRGNGTF